MERLSTGIAELDLICGGGLERGSMVILSGAPGVGKPILAQQICFANATEEHKATYYTTLSEPHTRLVRHLEGFDFFDAKALGVRVDFIHVGELIRQTETGGAPALISEITRQVFDQEPAVVVVDSAKALRDFISEEHLRTVYYDLGSKVAHTNAVLLMLGEYSEEEIESAPEFSLADGVIQLAYEPREPVDRRWLRVHKLRGGRHLMGKHSFQIDSSGFDIHPRLETLIPRAADRDSEGRLASGIPGLDEIMGGGIGRGEATVVMGPSGVGKTVFGLAFLHQGLLAQERGMYVSFQESADQLVRKAAQFGWDITAPATDGRLAMHEVPIGELDLDLVAAVVRHELERMPARRVIIDSLGELVFAARESDRFPAFARSPVGLIRAHGATLIVTSETTTLGPMAEPVGGLSFLFHNVILLRYMEAQAQMLRALNVIKMRNSNHEKRIFQYLIDGRGVVIGEPLPEVTGVLGWTALRTKE